VIKRWAALAGLITCCRRFPEGLVITCSRYQAWSLYALKVIRTKDGVFIQRATNPQTYLHASSLQNIYADREMTNHNFNTAFTKPPFTPSPALPPSTAALHCRPSLRRPSLFILPLFTVQSATLHRPPPPSLRRPSLPRSLAMFSATSE
jgi:hypothetical protein